LEDQKEFLSEQLGDKYKEIINHAIKVSDSFIEKKDLLAARLRDGFYRDCHGDLHSRNIFLLPAPVPFDCIEFNDDFRQIDVLNEVAFLCMDLDAFDRKDLSDLFIEDYNLSFPAIKTNEDHRLFIYYKSYRANVRAKVNSLRAKSAVDKEDKTNSLIAAAKYLDLMDDYLKVF
jgi:aminoglycoside phosphotransferase family enzyme